LDAVTPAVERMADHFADEVIHASTKVHDQWRETVGPTPEGKRSLPHPNAHVLVWQKVIVDGETKQRWIVLDPNDPEQTVDKVMEGYARDDSVRAQIVFEGVLVFRGSKDSGPTPAPS
jgi:hypothetical protein